jgi:hypothetical protein
VQEGEGFGPDHGHRLRADHAVVQFLRIVRAGRGLEQGGHPIDLERARRPRSELQFDAVACLVEEDLFLHGRERRS